MTAKRNKRKEHSSDECAKYTILKQVCNLIPPHLVNKLAQEYGVDEKSRTFTPWSHVTALMVAAGKLITFTIGIRFLADYLMGDVYFKVHRPGHNLDRARVQFKMVASMEQQEAAMRAVVRKFA